MRIGSILSANWSEEQGVIQGCVGGPPSFKLFTNDIQKRSTGDCSDQEIMRSKYADDTSDLVKAMSWLAAEIKLKFSIADMAKKSLANLLTLNLKNPKQYQSSHLKIILKRTATVALTG